MTAIIVRIIPDENSRIIEEYDSLFGKYITKVVTTLDRPSGADLMRHCWNCKKWTWLIGAFCAECYGRNA